MWWQVEKSIRRARSWTRDSLAPSFTDRLDMFREELVLKPVIGVQTAAFAPGSAIEPQSPDYSSASGTSAFPSSPNPSAAANTGSPFGQSITSSRSNLSMSATGDLSRMTSFWGASKQQFRLEVLLQFDDANSELAGAVQVGVDWPALLSSTLVFFHTRITGLQVDSSMTLSDVRKLINDELDDIPADFRFYDNDIPITMKQEAVRAVAFLC